MSKTRNNGGISLGVLAEIAKRNTVQVYLHTYLIHKHVDIFRRKAAQQKDYVVVFFASEKVEDFLILFSKNRKYKFPDPDMEFFEEKEEAGDLLGTNPNSAMAWRHSPKLELMY